MKRESTITSRGTGRANWGISKCHSALRLTDCSQESMRPHFAFGRNTANDYSSMERLDSTSEDSRDKIYCFFSCEIDRLVCMTKAVTLDVRMHSILLKRLCDCGHIAKL